MICQWTYTDSRISRDYLWVIDPFSTVTQVGDKNRRKKQFCTARHNSI